MARRLSRLPASLKGAADRLTVGMLVAVSVLLLVVGKADLKLVDAVATGAADLATPALQLVTTPLQAVRQLARGLGDSLAMAEENQRLREQVDRLRGWQAEAIRLDVENQALRRWAGMPPADPAELVTTAAIVGDTGGSFVQTRLIDAGAGRGVEIGQAVVGEAGLVGRIVSVGLASARVLLITDLNAKIPVLVEGSGDRALMEGDNGKRLRLRFLPRDPRFHVGDRVITSGDGGLIPAGIAVGVISRADPSRVEVTPFVDWARLDHVRVLRARPVAAPEAGQDLVERRHGAPADTRLAVRIGGSR
ncbi:rod shape-determining protein MreC [Geminicoccus roseus]|uniref:rod shape-determining protein MreC n=1 Tax=Geminicoccus roseus TaxID=404900 RepID=UPI000686B049|nr:rod shape-determining protein MreC [Geminicoccus roseus]